MDIHESQLNMINRATRIAIGVVLIGITMSASGTLGYLALLPLLAIYPLATGLLGEDPIDGMVTNWLGGFKGHCFRPSSRIALLAVGAGAIGIFMINPQSLVSLEWLTLASIYPIMAGLFGEDLFSSVFSGLFAGQEQVETRQPTTHQHVVGIKHQETTVHHHGFGHGHDSDHKAA